MGFPKTKRFKSEKALKEIRSRVCAVCGTPPPVHAHHLKTRGAFGGDFINNLLPLDFKCHNEIHAKGIWSFVKEHNLKVSKEFGIPFREISEEEELLLSEKGFKKEEIFGDYLTLRKQDKD